MKDTGDQVSLLSPPCLSHPPPSNFVLVQSIRHTIVEMFARDNEEGEES